MQHVYRGSLALMPDTIRDEANSICFLNTFDTRAATIDSAWSRYMAVIRNFWPS